MKKKLFLTILSLATLAVPVIGQTRDIRLSALCDYSYNTTYMHGVGLDLIADIPIGTAFDCEPALQVSSVGVHTAAVQTRALFPVGGTSLYLKNRIAFKDVARNDMYDACLGLSLGWLCRHADVEVGMFGRVMDGFGRDIHTLDAAICEPFNLIYSVKGILCKSDSCWNLWASLSNVDIFQLERMWQPIVSAGGWYDLSTRLSLRLEAVCKPAGMFHLNAEFYSINVRAGVIFKL